VRPKGQDRRPDRPVLEWKTMREFDLGSATPRTEDLQLLRGRGRYVDDIMLQRQAHLYVLRSPHAAAHIRSIDTKAG
jgi:carbon-monoxide dehydrogenase large subunit